MKFFRRLFLLFATLLFKQGTAYSQDTQEKNDSMFGEVKRLLNDKNGDALYALLNDNFKAKFTPEAFARVLNKGIYPMGAIQESSFLNYDKGVSNYKAVCLNAVLQLAIATDTNGKISGLKFTPFKEPIANKKNKVPTDNPLRSQTDRQVDTLARLYIDKINTVGLNIGILRGGNTTMYGYGATIKDGGNIPDGNSVFELGSITKTFTATLLAYYVSEHSVSLTDPITKYLPDSVAVNRDLAEITLLMLANHTSGLPRLPENIFAGNTDMMNPYKNYTEEKLYAYLAQCKPENKPGAVYSYSNLGGGLLANLLEKVSGETYENMVTNIICKPLHMVNTYQHPDDLQKKMQVSVYSEKGEDVVMWDMDALAGAGAFRSTVNDMLLYGRANLEKNKSTMSKAIELTHDITYNKEMCVGLGWHKKVIADKDCYWHNGGTGGSSSYIGFVPDKNICVVVLSNASANVDALAEGIIKTVQGSEAK